MEYLPLPARYGLHLGPSFILIDANRSAQGGCAGQAFHHALPGGPLVGLQAAGAAKGYGSCRGWAASVTFLCLTYSCPRSWDIPGAAARADR